MSSVRVSSEVKELLTQVCEDTNMNQGVVIGFLLEQAIKYNMFNPGWLDKITASHFNDLLQEADIDYRKKIEMEKFKSILSTKQNLIKEYLKTMTSEEKKTYIESALSLGKDQNLLDNLTSYQMYILNGEKKMLPPNADGSPHVPGVAPTKLRQCDQGWHVVNDNCLGCQMRRGCEIREGERIDWLALHGSKEEQDRALRGGPI